MQYEKKIMTKSQENEFGDKNNLETSPKMALFWAKYIFGLQTSPESARYHCCLP